MVNEAQRDFDSDTPSVLSVGQCGIDGPRLSRLLRGMGAAVTSASTAEEAMAALRAKPFALVLVNREFAEDGYSGVEFIGRARAEAGDARLMLVSDHADAQAAAMEAGAVEGFGKSELDSPETAEFLRAELFPDGSEPRVS
jgi:ActR/RegA family two-component response regulator